MIAAQVVFGIFAQTGFVRAVEEVIDAGQPHLKGVAPVGDVPPGQLQGGGVHFFDFGPGAVQTRFVDGHQRAVLDSSVQRAV